MRPIFSILSIAYIFCIFFWADSPMVSTLAPFNPHSLLHIPLYGILTILLIFTVSPLNHFLTAGLIALGVAIADEIYQSFLPSREASIIDIFLDLLGITFALFLIFWLYKKQKIQKTQLTL
jgi:VanZ family protein